MCVCVECVCVVGGCVWGCEVCGCVVCGQTMSCGLMNLLSDSTVGKLILSLSLIRCIVE